MGAEPFERAAHEAGHLVALARLFGLPLSPGFAVWFTTIEISGPSGGCVSWRPASDSDPTKVAAALLCGWYAHLLCCGDVSLEESKRQAEDDLKAIDELHLPDDALRAADELAGDLVAQNQLALPKIARELVRQRTFYGVEGLVVVFAHAPDQPRSTRKKLKKLLQQYRRERDESQPPSAWKERGPWLQPWGDWMARCRRPT